MNRKTLICSIATTTTLTLFAAGCSSGSSAPAAAVPLPERSSVAADPHFIDPRIGYDTVMAPAVQRRFDAAWNAFLAGDLSAARTRFAELAAQPGGLPPALVAETAIDLREGDLDAARTQVERAQSEVPHYTAALVYAGEIALAQHDERTAFERYRAAAAMPDAPSIVRERAAELERGIFERLMQSATVAVTDEEAVGTLREALTIQPESQPTRILLVRRLVTMKKWDDARHELDPLLNSAAVDLPDVQETLAEIDAGRGRYQEAIVRYDRLAHRDKSGRFDARLDELKQAWSSANMPPQYRAAMNSEAITRGDLAVLLYWRVQSIRFAQNLGAPPIAVDIGSDATGREEIIRSIALGLLQVDPVTRRVDPSRQISSGTLSRYLSRVLVLRGAPCARALPASPASGNAPSLALLAACGISDPARSTPDAPVSGRVAAEALGQLDRALSAEKR